MKRKRIFLGCFLIVAIFPLVFHDKPANKLPDTATLTLNSDSFFGLTPIARVCIPLNDTLTLTGYAPSNFLKS